MEIPADRLNKQKEEFMQLKEKIVNELGFQGLDDDEIEKSLKLLIGLESENFDNSMNDLVLRKYYNYFLDDIFPAIYSMITLKEIPSVNIKYYNNKKEINALNKEALNRSLAAYFYSINDGFLVNTVNSHESHLTGELEKLIVKDDVFRTDYKYDPKIMSKHPVIDFNYDIRKWISYAIYVQKRLSEIEKNLNDKIPDFEQSSELYEYHIKLYRDYVVKYRYISAAGQISSKTK